MSAVISTATIRKLSDELNLLNESLSEYCWITISRQNIELVSDGEISCNLLIDCEQCNTIQYDDVAAKVRNHEFISLLETLSKNKNIKFVSLEIQNGKLIVSSDHSQYSMTCEVCADKPILFSQIDGTTVIGGTAELLSIKSAINFCEKSKSSIMSGVLYRVSCGVVTIASTNSTIMFERVYDDNEFPDASFIIPSKWASIIPKSASVIHSYDECVLVNSDSFTAKFRCMSGKYPKYDIIFKEFETDCIISLKDIKNSILEMRDVAPKDENTKVRLSMEKGIAELSTKSDTLSAKSSFGYTPSEINHRFLVSLEKLKNVVGACTSDINIGIKHGILYLKSDNTRFAIALME